MFSVLAQSGSGGGPNWAAWAKILIFAIFIGFSVLSWIFKQLKEQNARKEVIRQRERAREEMLRTGRTEQGVPSGQALEADMQMQMPVSADDAKRRLQEIAAKRRAELERLARSQGAGGAGGSAGAPPTSAPPMSPQPARMPPRPASMPPVAKAGPMPAPVDLARQREEENRRRSAHQKAVRKAAEAEKRKAAAAAKVRAREAEARADEARQSDYAEQVAMEGRRAASAAAASAGPSSGSGAGDGSAAQAAATAGRGMSAIDSALTRTSAGAGQAADWRRAFVLSELLRPPVTERDQERLAG